MNEKHSLWGRVTGFFGPGQNTQISLTCPEVRKLASGYLEHEETQEAFNDTLFQKARQHLKGCVPCRSFLNSLRRTIDMLAKLPRTPAPETLRRNILSKIDKS